MAKNVIVVASGETERRSLRHLVEHLKRQDTSVSEVLIPPSTKALNAEMAEKLIKSACHESRPSARLVSLTTRGARNNTAIRFGTAISPFSVSARLHTSWRPPTAPTYRKPRNTRR